MSVEHCVICNTEANVVKFPGAGEECAQCGGKGWPLSEAKIESRFDFEDDETFLDKTQVLRALKGDKLVGELRYDKAEDGIRIHSLYVEEDQRGEGAATELVRELFVRRNPGVDGYMTIWQKEDAEHQKNLFEGRGK